MEILLVAPGWPPGHRGEPPAAVPPHASALRDCCFLPYPWGMLRAVGGPCERGVLQLKLRQLQSESTTVLNTHRNALTVQRVSSFKTFLSLGAAGHGCCSQGFSLSDPRGLGRGGQWEALAIPPLSLAPALISHPWKGVHPLRRRTCLSFKSSPRSVRSPVRSSPPLLI